MQKKNERKHISNPFRLKTSQESAKNDLHYLHQNQEFTQMICKTYRESNKVGGIPVLYTVSQ